MNTFSLPLRQELAKHIVAKLPKLIGTDVNDLENAIFDNYIEDPIFARNWLYNHFTHILNAIELVIDHEIALHGKVMSDLKNDTQVVQSIVYTCQLEEVFCSSQCDHVTELDNVLTAQDVVTLTTQLRKSFNL